MSDSSWRENMKHITCFLLVGLVLLCSIYTTTIHAQVSTTFDSDLEGWQVTGDNSVAWEAATGNPGGCLSVNDWAIGDYNYAIAPPVYHGDWSMMTSLDSLSVDIFHSSADPDDYPPDYIFRIAGPGGSAYTFSGPSYQPVKNVWNHYIVSLDPADWTIESGTWVDILQAVYSLRICGEFTTGDEICRIDNVHLTSTPSYIYFPCVYDDFNSPGTGDWSFSETDGATNPGSTGNGGGFVEIDDGTGISKALAPAKFLGDWSNLDNSGYITIDLRVISHPATTLGIGEFIRISGPGGMAHVDLDPADLPESKYIWKTFVFQLNTSIWTLDSGTWADLLSNVTECRITVEFYDGLETIGFDNFGRQENSCPPIDRPVHFHDPGITDCGYYSFVYIASVAHNPMDGEIYGLITSTTGSGGGIYPVSGSNPGIRMQAYDRPIHLIFDADGDCYISENYDGEIYRLEWGGSSSLWVSGFHGGEPDPVGMTFAPPGFNGLNTVPGDILVVDQGAGASAYDEIWSFSPDIAEEESLVVYDLGDIDYIDIAAGLEDTVFVCDSYHPTNGLYAFDTFAIAPVVLNTPVAAIISVVYDGIEDDIYIASAADTSVYRVDRWTGDVSRVLSGFSNFLRCCLEIDPANRRLWVTDNGYSRVYEFCLDGITGIEDHIPDIKRRLSLEVFPNPFNPTATISFTLRRPSDVRLDIFDVAGRRIRTLLDGRSVAGTHKIIWNGQSDSKTSSSSGVYFVRITSEGYTETVKVVLIR
jgi:hypothetical protein